MVNILALHTQVINSSYLLKDALQPDCFQSTSVALQNGGIAHRCDVLKVKLHDKISNNGWVDVHRQNLNVGGCQQCFIFGCCQMPTLYSTIGNATRLWRMVEYYWQGKK